MSVDIHYYNNEPAWKIAVADPERFRGVRYDLEIKFFRLPVGGLVALWLRLYDDPDRPFFLHRVLDPSDAQVGKYLEAVQRHEGVVLFFESPKEQQGFAVDVPVDSQGLAQVLKEARAHTEALGDDANAQACVKDFLDVFEPALKKEKSVEAAWQRVIIERPYIPPGAPPPPPATSSWGGIMRLLAASTACLVLGTLFRAWTPLKANAGLETPVVRPGYLVKVYIGKETRAIGGRWNGQAPSFILSQGERSFIDSIQTHSDEWMGRISETQTQGAPPSFRPYVEIRLKDDADLAGKTLRGSASVRAVYPIFSGVAYKETAAIFRKDISISVFTFKEYLLVRAAPLLTTVGIFLTVLTCMALYGRLKTSATLDE